MHNWTNREHWASLFPLIQVAHNVSHITTVQEVQVFHMFGRPARLPADVILGIPYEGSTADTKELTQQTRANLQIAFELARRNLSEREANKRRETIYGRRTLCFTLTSKF